MSAPEMKTSIPTVNPRFSVTVPEWVNNHLELWAGQTAQNKGSLTTSLIVRGLRDAIRSGECPALINLDTVTPDERKQLDEAVNTLVKHMNLTREQAVMLLYKAQQIGTED